ncbi:MAG: ABC transporter substrate-binding protein [Burkholderiales bacterium]|nr:ABC transporter substrate-binding protein [Burkholderiales bacterium]MDE1927803.1 ABC transporter substrate-binding protein [Burkholderiales bacterium]MDE2158671.1 ABC transporter substrate-binding protein [Burkholderiales bacterium]MDE2501510.1 ABC transporter substrate-binding protein [Burkholderiales bacterium]
MRQLGLRFTVGLAVLLLAASAGAQYRVRDDLGREVRFDAAPARVVSMLPSITETVCALGACGRLVGTDRYSNWPPEVASLPKAGGLDDAQVERIVALHPDLVLLSGSARVTDRLAQLGVRTVAIDTDRYADIARSITLVAQALGVPARAPPLQAQIEREVDALARSVQAARHGQGPSVYFEVDESPYAAGPTSFIGELLTRLGARNIVPASLGPFPRINPEFVVRADPEVIFVAPQDAPGLAQRPGWSGIRAVREHHICTLAGSQRDAVVRPGPRVAEGMRAIEACLEMVAP